MSESSPCSSSSFPSSSSSSSCFSLSSTSIDDYCSLCTRNFGTLLSLLAQSNNDAAADDIPSTPFRSSFALGAQIPSIDNPWIDAIVINKTVSVAQLNEEEKKVINSVSCIWINRNNNNNNDDDDDILKGSDRIENASIAMPLMIFDLSWLPLSRPSLFCTVGTPSFDSIGALSDSAYHVSNILVPLLPRLAHQSAITIKRYGYKKYDVDRLLLSNSKIDNQKEKNTEYDNEWACALITLDMGDNVGIHYVATDKYYRKKGLATNLLTYALFDAKERGIRTASLEASVEGRSVYERMGFQRVGLLRAFIKHSRSDHDRNHDNK